jgi:hypothetical protein
MNQTSTKGTPTLIFLHVKIFNVLILNDWLNFEHLTSIYIYDLTKIKYQTHQFEDHFLNHAPTTF